MKQLWTLVLMVLLVFTVACSGGTTSDLDPDVDREVAGFDEYGYNEVASIFNGDADGVDRNLDGTFWGNTTYANDHLNMNWNNEWNRGNDEGWSNGPYRAWTTNHWNGQNGGSGEIWHYKFIWVGSDLQNSEYWIDGGYPIWGQFEVIFSHGTSANQHFWDTHATPASLGFGNWN